MSGGSSSVEGLRTCAIRRGEAAVRLQGPELLAANSDAMLLEAQAALRGRLEGREAGRTRTRRGRLSDPVSCLAPADLCDTGSQKRYRSCPHGVPKIRH